MESLVFDSITPKEVHIKIGEAEYKLKEALEKQHIIYKDEQLRATKIKDGEFAGLEGMSAADSVFLAACMVQVMPNGNEAPVTKEFIRSLPLRVYQPLFDKLEEISGLKDNKTIEELTKEMDKLQKKIDKKMKDIENNKKYGIEKVEENTELKN